MRISWTSLHFRLVELSSQLLFLYTLCHRSSSFDFGNFTKVLDDNIFVRFAFQNCWAKVRFMVGIFINTLSWL